MKRGGVGSQTALPFLVAGASSSEGDHHLHHLGRGSKDSSSSAQVSEATTLLATDHDIDENKYKRKSAIEMLFRWIKNFASGSRRRHSRVQRCAEQCTLVAFRAGKEVQLSLMSLGT